MTDVNNKVDLFQLFTNKSVTFDEIHLQKFVTKEQ